jgi:hypothetical protein
VQRDQVLRINDISDEPDLEMEGEQSPTLSEGEGGFCQVETATCYQTKYACSIGWRSEHVFID